MKTLCLGRTRNGIPKLKMDWIQQIKLIQLKRDSNLVETSWANKLLWNYRWGWVGTAIPAEPVKASRQRYK